MLFSVIHMSSITLTYFSDSVLFFLLGASILSIWFKNSKGNIHLLSYCKIQPFNDLWVLCISFCTSYSSLVIYYGFCWLLTAIVSRISQYVCEISRGKTSNLLSIYRHHLHCCICSVYWISFCVANLSYNLCLMMFVFLRPEICRRLPSDSTSRWTPLP